MRFFYCSVYFASETCIIHIYFLCEFDSQSDEIYSIQHYVIKLVSDLQEVGGFLQILLKVALNTITPIYFLLLLHICLDIRVDNISRFLY